MNSILKTEWFSASSAQRNRVAVLLVLLSIASPPVSAEDICSSEGKSKMRAANVSEVQIARICPAPTAQSTTSVPLIDMDDLRIDIASLGGRKIRVRGIGQYMMDMFMLKKNAFDMSPMLVDITRLDRDQRRKILQQCADIMTGCNVMIHGTVGKGSYQNGIVAERVEW